MIKYKITDEMYKTLNAHKNRTGMGATAIYKYMKVNGFIKPDSNITARRIESWLKRKTRSAYRDDLLIVMAVYESIDNKNDEPRLSAQRVIVDDDFLEKLKYAFRQRANFSVEGFLKRNNAPKKLTGDLISNLKLGKIETIAVHHKDFLDKAIIFLNKS